MLETWKLEVSKTLSIFNRVNTKVIGGPVSLDKTSELPRGRGSGFPL